MQCQGGRPAAAGRALCPPQLLVLMSCAITAFWQLQDAGRELRWARCGTRARGSSSVGWDVLKRQQILLRCCDTLLHSPHRCCYLVASLLLRAHVSVQQDGREYVCCLAAGHGSDRSVHLQ